MVLIYGILFTLAVVGGLMLNLSADFAIQLQQYDFGNNTARVSWNKDALLNGGSGLIVTVLLIFLYNEVQNARVRAERERKLNIAASRLIVIYRNTLYLAIYNLRNFNDEFDSGKNLKDIFNGKFYDDISKVDFKSTSYLGFEEKPKLLYVADRFKQLSENVEKIMIIYEIYFNAELCELINETFESNFLLFIKSMAYIAEHTKSSDLDSKPFYLDEPVIDELKILVDKHIKLINYLEKLK